MSNCYFFKEINYNNGILDNCIDATYIIHLEGNGRINHIQEQLSNFQPSKTLFILFNKGYKNCCKESYINKSQLDLVDAFLQIFKHANYLNYNNILILEDDFIFNKEIKNKEIPERINNFINKQTNKNLVYALGLIPIFQFPVNLYTNYVAIGAGTHAIIYTNEIRKTILDIPISDINDWDGFLNRFNINKFSYYRPLCYQLFPVTENSNNWFSKNINLIIRKIIILLKLDIQCEPGYTICYILSISIIFIIFIILYLIIKKIKYKI